jgi:hypothetical protein
MTENIGLYQVLSYYTQIFSTPRVDTEVHVRHIKEKGQTRIEEVVFQSYNAKGEVVKHHPYMPRVDITV